MSSWWLAVGLFVVTALLYMVHSPQPVLRDGVPYICTTRGPIVMQCVEARGDA